MIPIKTIWIISLAAFAIALAFPFSLAASPATLEIARQGYFFVGGHYEQTPAGTVMDGQMFVQFQIPAGQRSPYPIVLIHGQGQSGVNFISTPDGREGWATYFLRRGYAVYVVDQALRGRSPYHAQLDGDLGAFTPERTEQLFTRPERRGPWPSAKLHSQWPGSGAKGDPIFDQFYAAQLDSSSDDLRMDILNRDAGVALLDKIGPSILLTHSRAGAFGWLLADARPALVRAIVAVEPWGPPFREVNADMIGGSGSTVPVLKRPWGLTVAPMTFDPPAASAADLNTAQEPSPQPGKAYRCWAMGPLHRTLPHLAGLPVLIVTGEASYHSLYDHCTSQFLTEAGVKNDWLALGVIGIHGNGHMMMLERNNQQIARAISQWLAHKLRGAKGASVAEARSK